VRFAYEWHDDAGQWFRAYGNENWEFDENGLMRRRLASINDLPIAPSERQFHWRSDGAIAKDQHRRQAPETPRKLFADTQERKQP